MTPADIKSGTDRVRHVASGKDWDVVINLQGDEPLMDPEIIDRLTELFAEERNVQIATAAARSTSFEDFMSPNVVKVVAGKNGTALYFSRSPIPHSPDENFRFFSRHIGIYAFRGGILEALIKVIEVDYEPVAVDTPGDLEVVRKKILQEEGFREA
jgi:3-deoxy-manno-octulosonate cytidylyltransferase (CMP-KDO synthetase)